MLNIGEHATIGVFGHFGNQNLGDETIISAVVQNIRLRLPKAKIIGFSLRPDDTKVRHDIPAYPIQHIPQAPSQTDSKFKNDSDRQHWAERAKVFLKRFRMGRMVIAVLRAVIRFIPALTIETRLLRRSYKVLKDVDLLMITGSNQFLDHSGLPWGFPYNLLKWSMMAKLAGSEIIYVSVGAGPINSKLSMVMIRLALKFSAYTSFRDVRSQHLIEKIGYKGATKVFPDLAYSYCSTGKADKHNYGELRDRKPTVGINPMPIYDSRYWYIHDAGKYASYVNKLAKFSAVLFREGYPLVFWGTQPKDQNVIVDVLACLETALGEKVNRNKCVSYASSVDELSDVIDSFDIVVATRFHGIVLPLSAGKPVLSICYHKKLDDLMKEMGQSEYSVMFDAFNPEDLVKRFKRLEKDMEGRVEEMKRKTAEYRKALASQYDLLFGAPVASARTN